MQKLINSARTGKFVANAIVPRFVRQMFSKEVPTLDFGCGYGDHVIALVAEGFKVSGTDLMINRTFNGPSYNAIRGYQNVKFDQVYASNVFNIQPTAGWLWQTCKEIGKFTAPSGFLLWNFPRKPRYNEFEESYILKCLEYYGGFVEHDLLDKVNRVYVSMRGDSPV